MSIKVKTIYGGIGPQVERKINETLAGIEAEGGSLNRVLGVPSSSEGMAETVYLFYTLPDPEPTLAEQAQLELEDQEITLRIIAKEKEHLAEIAAKAREIDGDPYWSGFKNAKQKELYLLSTYSLSRADAELVSELLKPEMLVVRNFGRA
jgi:hypothetical protein